MIMATQLPFKDIRETSGFKLSKLANEAGVSVASIRRIEEGGRVTKAMVYCVLIPINKKMGTSYTIEDISGLNIID